MKTPDKSWSERKHYIREEFDDDYHPEGVAVWLVVGVLLLVVVFACVAFWRD